MERLSGNEIFKSMGKKGGIASMYNFNMVKLEIFIPCSHLEPLREALRLAGAGSSGNYDSVLSCSMVKGCWRPLPHGIIEK